MFDDTSPDENFRIPVISFIAAGREHVLAADGTRGGGPDAVLEIRSPGDETYEKLPFFAKLGVREVVVIDRDSKRPEVLRLGETGYLAVATDRSGGVPSEVLRVRFRLAPGETPSLIVDDLDDPAVLVQI